MHRAMTAIVIFCTIAASTAAASASSRPTALATSTDLPGVVVRANRQTVRDIYEDFLGRPPTTREIREFEHALGSTATENDVRKRVLGSRDFWLLSGALPRKFINLVYVETIGRRAKLGELRTLQRVYRNTEGTNGRKRRVVAARILALTGYDDDAFDALALTVNRTDAGGIRRISLRLDKPVDETTSSMYASINGQLIQGRTKIRAGGRVIAIIPDSPVMTTGRLVATAFSWSDGTTRADASQRVDPIIEDIFPAIRVVAYYGNHQTPLLGVLGETGPEAAARRVKAAAAPFSEPGRPAVGAFELIATVAQRSAGLDGNYSEPSKLAELKVWIDVAQREGLFVILDIQPGRSDFLTETVRYRDLLLEPNVGLALDPEWRMGPNERPGQSVGSVSATELNRVSKWLNDLVIDNDLPQKLFIIHQFQSRMVRNRENLVDRPGLATIIHADGFGGRAIKRETYRIIQARAPFWNGFKLFIDEDTRIFQPAEVLAFDTIPVPDLITYQ